MGYKGCKKALIPFRNRVFPVLVLTKRNFAAESPHEPSRSFLVVQIPLDLSEVSAAHYSDSSHETLNVADPEQKKAVAIGKYASVEHCYQRPGCPNLTRWRKALAMDLGGRSKGSHDILLQHVVPTLLCENVDAFIQWSRDGRVERPRLPTLVSNPPSDEAAKKKDASFEETELFRTTSGRKRRSDGTIEPEKKSKIRKAIGSRCNIL